MADSIFSDTKKQFVYVILSFIASIVYLKKKWYEYWGLWMLLLSFILFIVFTMASRTTLMEGLFSVFPTDIIESGYGKPLLWILASAPFFLILTSLIILMVISTAIVKKKQKDHKYRDKAFQLSDKKFLKNYYLIDFSQIFDLLISSFSFLIFFVYSSNFGALFGVQPSTYVDPVSGKLYFQYGWLFLTYFTSLGTSIAGTVLSSNALKIQKRMMD